jgi:hypothetical protein
MARIIDITPRSKDVSPVLMLLTSHRADCFLLCVKCLELYTDLSRFSKVYVLANAVGDEHAVLIKAFQQRHRNVIDIHLTPRGIVPAVLAMQNFIMARHPEAVFIKLEEDVFVTPGWLEQLLSAYKLHLGSHRVAAVVPVMPATRTGRQVMGRLLRTHWPAERQRLPDLPVEKNGPYHRLAWELVLGQDLAAKYAALDKPRFYYLGHVSNNLVLYDARLTSRILPMPLRQVEGVTRMDEFNLNSALRANDLRVAVCTGVLAHHFAHAGCEEYLRRHVSLDDVWWLMTGLGQEQPYRDALRFTSARRDNRASRLMRERRPHVLS